MVFGLFGFVVCLEPVLFWLFVLIRLFVGVLFYVWVWMVGCFNVGCLRLLFVGCDMFGLV